MRAKADTNFVVRPPLGTSAIIPLLPAASAALVVRKGIQSAPALELIELDGSEQVLPIARTPIRPAGVEILAVER
jgi:hypothetical protein